MSTLFRTSLTVLAALAAAASFAQVSPGGYVFAGDRGIRESVRSSAPLRMVAIGQTSMLGLRADGTLVGWGDMFNHRLDIPAGLMNVQQIASGPDHSLALKADGTVVAWGNNNNGQCAVPAGLTNVIAVGAAYNCSFAILADHSVVAWGAVPTLPNGLSLTHVQQIAGGEGFVVALKTDGTVVAWGTNYLGQCAVPATLSGVTQISVGKTHTLALKSDGTVVGWGDSAFGSSVVPVGLTNVKTIATGYGHSIALKTDGTLVGFGSNTYNQYTFPAGLTDVADIFVGYDNTLILKKDGSVVALGAWAFNQASPTDLTGVSDLSGCAGNFVGTSPTGQIRLFSRTDRNLGNLPSGNVKYRAAVVGQFHGVAVRETGTLTSWGDQSQQGTPPPTLTYPLTLSTGFYHSVAVNGQHAAVTWGSNDHGQAAIPAGLSSVNQLAAGIYFTAALKADGTVSVWGDNTYGQLNVPAGLSGIGALACGNNHVIALRTDGTVTGWGSNIWGERVPPAGLTGVRSISAGESTSLAVRTDDTVVGWGSDTLGQISGISGMTNVATAVASGSASAALLKMHVAVAPYLIPGGQYGSGTVYLATPAPAAGTVVSLTSSNPAVVGVPTTVTVPAGARLVTFPIKAPNQPSLKQALITATLGTLNQSCLVSVSPSPFTLGFNQTKVTGGSTMPLNVSITRMTAAPTGGYTVNLSASSTNIICPATATIPAGQKSVTVSLTHTPVNSETTVNVVVSEPNYSVTTPVTVSPFKVAAFTVTPSIILGSLPLDATLTLDQTPGQNLTVPVTSDTPSAIANQIVTVPALSKTAPVQIPTTAVSTHQSVKLTATLGTSFVTRTVKLTKALQTIKFETPLYGNSRSTVTITTALPAPAGGITIALTGTHLTTPSQVTIPVGATSVQFQVEGENVQAGINATLTATALSATLTSTVALHPNVMTAFTVSPSTVTGPTRDNIVGTVKLSAPVAHDSVITILVSPFLLNTPATLTIPANATQGTFKITALNVSKTTLAPITVKYLGFTKSATLTLNP